MRKLDVMVVGGVVGLVGASAAWAHGPQLQISRDAASGRIQTREVIDTHDAPAALSPLKSVYVMPFAPTTDATGTAWYVRPDQRTVPATGLPEFNSSPGLSWQYDLGSFAQGLAGTNWAHSGSATLPNLNGTQFGFVFADGLKQWDGTAFVDAGTEQVEMYRGNFNNPAASATSSDAAPFVELTLAAIAASPVSANPHGTVGFRMLGDGSSRYAAGDDGVYLLSLKVTSTATGVEDSDPFFFVLAKNAPPAQVTAAVASLGVDPSLVQVVPEPASLSMLAAGALALLARRRAGGKL